MTKRVYGCKIHFDYLMAFDYMKIHCYQNKKKRL